MSSRDYKMTAMYGFKAKMVFCKYHPHKKCEHFCRDHTVLLCSVCLREKHRGCQISDETEVKSFYGQKIRDANAYIEAEKNETLGKTDAVVQSLDTGIVRLSKYRKDIDAVITRLHEMKDEVEGQRADIRKTSYALKDIERSLNTANELKQCKQCYTDVDIERIKFERKQVKIIKTPGRLNEEIKTAFSGLTKKLKSVRVEVEAKLSESQLHLELKGREGNKSFKDFSTNPPSMDIKRKYARMRPVRDRMSLLNSMDPDGRRTQRVIQDDGRVSIFPYQKHIRLPAIPGSNKPMKKTVIRFTGFRSEKSRDESQWHMT